VLGDAYEEDFPLGGAAEQFFDPLCPYPPVRLEVPVYQHERAGLGLLYTAADEAPFGPVPQKVEIHGRLGGYRGTQLGKGPPPIRATRRAREDVHVQLAFFLERATAPLPACPRRPRHRHLEAAPIGDEGLAAVYRPAVGWCWQRLERPQLHGRQELEVAPGRVRELPGLGGEKLGQAAGGVGDCSHDGDRRPTPCRASGFLVVPPERVAGRFPRRFGENGRMPRAIWSGSISFGLVNVPVKLVAATSPKDVRFHQLHAPDQGRIQQKRVCSLDGKEVDYSEIVKGYEVSRDRYVVVEPEELEALAPEASRYIELEEFVDLAAIDPLYFEHSYYLVPDGPAARPYALLVEAMEGTGKAGIGKFVLRTKQYLAALRPKDGALVLSTMLFDDEVVATSALEVPTTKETKPSEREVSMARQLLSSLSAEWEPTKYKDDYREKVLAMIEAKAAGNEVAVPEVPERRAPVIDLMAALEASLAQAAEGGRPQAAPGGRARGKAQSTRNGQDQEEAGEEVGRRRRPSKRASA
jgi:DNA end-binding protein Ku